MSIITFHHQPVQHLSRYVLGCVLALLTFTVLLALVMLVPAVSDVDAVLSNGVQQLRNPELDRLMLGITLLADYRAAASVLLILLAGLITYRRWWLALHVSCVAASAVLGVTILKSILGRLRPELTEGVLDSFSFPSGHACTGALLAGVLALLFGYRQTTTVRVSIYAIAVLFALLVAFSRVYLSVHWPTDVIAGLALGYTLVVAFAWQLHIGMTLNTRYLTPILMIATVLIMTIHILLNFSDEAIRYAVTLST